MSNGHEGPIDIANLGTVGFPRRTQVADNAFRAAQLHAEIPTARMVHIHGHGDMLQSGDVCLVHHIAGDLIRARQALIALGDLVQYPEPWRVEPCLWLDQIPCFGFLNQGVGINFTITPIMAEFLADLGLLPASIGFVNRDCRLDHQVLRIAPRQLRPSAQSKGHRARTERASRRRPTMKRRALVGANVSGMDGIARATAVRDNQLGRAGFGVSGVLAFAINCAYCDTVDAVGVPIEVAVVIRCRTVASGENENRTFPIPAILYTVHDGAFD